MDRRELFGFLGAVSAAPICGAVASAAHDEKGGKHEGPMSAPHFHFCGIHMAKKNPKLQFVTQHYCAAHTGGSEGDVFQCTLFDGTGKNAKLIGVEYLISDAAYRKLSDDEKKYWHAHTYEVLGGGLIAPAMSEKEETDFMKVVMTLWGKAWHTWPDPATPIPTGEPLLIWSLMGPGQVNPELEAKRDKDFKVNTKELSAKRVQTFGLQPPNVSVPKDMNVIGRLWTDTGDDKPTPKK